MKEEVGLRDFYNAFSIEENVYKMKKIKNLILNAVKETKELINKYPVYNMPQDECLKVHKMWQDVLNEARKLDLLTEPYWNKKLEFWSSEKYRADYLGTFGSYDRNKIKIEIPTLSKIESLMLKVK